jgi:hypothetical protein
LKNSGTQARAALALRLAESSDKTPRNYSAAVKQAPPSAASALRAHKVFTSKVQSDRFKHGKFSDFRKVGIFFNEKLRFSI